jgi:hypothetical protein
MANEEQLERLKRGVEGWNRWREECPDEKVDLSDGQLRELDLTRADLYRADLRRAEVLGTNLTEADLRRADLYRADLSGSNLMYTDLTEADLTRTDLSGCYLLRTRLEGALLRDCRVFGVAAWDVQLAGAIQTGLVITPDGQAEITVDDLEVAQFMYLLLNNERIKKVIEVVTSKVVLILGRYTPERRAVLDALRDTLRRKNYSPVVFDFGKPSSRDLTETIRILAGMSRFVIADITDAKSIAQELSAIVPDLPSVPVQPLLLASQQEYGMFEHFRHYPWVLRDVLYGTADQLVTDVDELVIAPAERWLEERTRK